MSQTLMDLLEGDLGATKVASAAPQLSAADDVSIEKIAAELGLFTDSDTKVASSDKKDDKKDEDKKEDGNPFAKKDGEKCASVEGIGGLFESLFPTDTLGGATKVASMSKEAAAEEALGSRTFDHYAARWDQRIEKLAMGSLLGWAKGKLQGNRVPNDEAARSAGGGPIDTTPHITNEIKPENGGAVVGREGAGGNVKAAAFQKHLLLSQLEG